MTLADLIVAEAAQRGLRHFFGLPGSGSPMDMMDAGRRMGVEFVTVAHESSAAIMAAYNGMMHGTAGLALAIKGVGAGNLAAGAVNAYFERMPVVCVCECSPASVKQREMIQHCNHRGLFGAVAKVSGRLGRGNWARDTAGSGRSGCRRAAGAGPAEFGVGPWPRRVRAAAARSTCRAGRIAGRAAACRRRQSCAKVRAIPWSLQAPTSCGRVRSANCCGSSKPSRRLSW